MKDEVAKGKGRVAEGKTRRARGTVSPEGATRQRYCRQKEQCMRGCSGSRGRGKVLHSTAAAGYCGFTQVVYMKE